MHRQTALALAAKSRRNISQLGMLRYRCCVAGYFYQRRFNMEMPDRSFERMTKAEVVAAQRSWAKCVTDQDVDGLLALYDFGNPDEPLLFKPTLADVIRLDEKGARAYFVGGHPDYPQDNGFLKLGWKKVEFQSAVGPILKAGGLGYKDMGHYTFVDGAGNATRADYTFAYHKLNGRVLISLHHSSLTWFPPTDG